MHVVEWMLKALVNGTSPPTKYDGSPWDRVGQAGKDLGCRAVLLYAKGDWAEFQKSFGLSPWNS
eukprot:3627778-Pyramimonas_sp.AAC.1